MSVKRFVEIGKFIHIGGISITCCILSTPDVVYEAPLINGMLDTLLIGFIHGVTNHVLFYRLTTVGSCVSLLDNILWKLKILFQPVKCHTKQNKHTLMHSLFMPSFNDFNFFKSWSKLPL